MSSIEEVASGAIISTGRRDRNEDGSISVAIDRLVERARSGDRDAFGELFRLHHAAVFRMARFHVGDAAEDTTAETFLRAWQALPRYRNVGVPFVAWLFGIARHVVADERARQRRVDLTGEVPDRTLEFREDDRLTLADAISRLPTEQRQVVELRYLAGLTNEEVGAALGRTAGAINALRWRALERMRILLGEA